MHKVKILIVEDEPIVALDIKNTLIKLGHTVTDTVTKIHPKNKNTPQKYTKIHPRGNISTFQKYTPGVTSPLFKNETKL